MSAAGRLQRIRDLVAKADALQARVAALLARNARLKREQGAGLRRIQRALEGRRRALGEAHRLAREHIREQRGS
jgi:hypothetical protein